MKSRILACFSILFFIVLVAGVQAEAPRKVLVKGDVERLIKTLPALAEDLDHLGIEIEAEGDGLTLPESLKANKQYVAILKKHGWDVQFGVKFNAIVMAYALIVSADAMKNADAEINAAIAEIRASEDLTPAQKKQAIDSLEQSRSAGANNGGAGISVHKDDVALVKPHVTALTNLFDSMDLLDKTSNNEDESDMDDDDALDAVDD